MPHFPAVRLGLTWLLIPVGVSLATTALAGEGEAAASDAPVLVIARDPDEPPFYPEAVATELSAGPLVFGCEAGTMGPTAIGWCHERTFYGPLYLGNLVQIDDVDDETTVIGLGQVGLFHVSSFEGLFRAGLINSGVTSRWIEIGLVDLSLERFSGLQLSGVVGYADNFRGLQVAPLALSGTSFQGVQVGVLAGADKVKGLSVGLVSLSGETSGLVVGAGVTTAYDLVGASIGGLYNVALTNVHGLQIGAFNFAADDLEGVQLGAVNYARENDVVQLGGVNVAGSVQGLQLGLVNFTTRLNGVQVGVINVSLEGGFPFMILGNAG